MNIRLYTGAGNYNKDVKKGIRIGIKEAMEKNKANMQEARVLYEKKGFEDGRLKGLQEGLKRAKNDYQEEKPTKPIIDNKHGQISDEQIKKRLQDEIRDELQTKFRTHHLAGFKDYIKLIGLDINELYGIVRGLMHSKEMSNNLRDYGLPPMRRGLTIDMLTQFLHEQFGFSL
jgi:hypothetical protein